MTEELDPRDQRLRELVCVMCGVVGRFVADPETSSFVKAFSSGWKRLNQGWICPECERK